MIIELVYGVYTEELSILEKHIGTAKFNNILKTNHKIMELYRLQKGETKVVNFNMNLQDNKKNINKRHVIIGGGAIIGLILLIVLIKKRTALKPFFKRILNFIIQSAGL